MESGIIKPKSRRYKKVLKDREPKIHENDKKALLIRGGNTSDAITTILKDFYMLKKPNAILFRKKNVMRPFEDTSSLEFLTKMNDTSLFLFGSHSKKRPHNLVFGRTFDNQILDMIEVGVENHQSLQSIKSGKCAIATKPCLIFSGAVFETEPELQRFKSLMIDFFRGPVVDNVRLSGLEHVIQFTAVDLKVYMRSYKVSLKKSGSRTPRVELQDMGPNMDFTLRRIHLASDELIKKACRKPKGAKPKKVKNVSSDMLGTKHGRIHMQSQDLNTLQLRKVKALKRKLDLPTEENDVSKAARTADGEVD